MGLLGIKSALGSSIWICWNELRRPDLDSVFVSRFRFMEETEVLDFRLPPQLTWKMFESVLNQSKSLTPPAFTAELLARYDDDYIASQIMFWPLNAACSIQVDSIEGSFFPQYIVPQLLLQWVTKEKKVEGIRYFSTRRSAKDLGLYVYANCVFPVRDITKEATVPN
jgi:hypothetical protein